MSRTGITPAPHDPTIARSIAGRPALAALLLAATLLLAACGGGDSSPAAPADEGSAGDSGNGTGGDSLTWTHPAGLADNISPDASDVDLAHDQKRVAMDDTGNTLVFWLQRYEATGRNKFYLSERRAGAWTHPANAADFLGVSNANNSAKPDAAMDNNGNAIVAWSEFDGSVFRVLASEYRSSAWTHPAAYTDAFDPGGQNAQFATVAMDDGGEALIAWNAPTGLSNCGAGSSPCKATYLATYNGTAWSLPANLADHVSPGSPIAFDPPDAAMDGNGNAVVVWEQDSAIFVSTYNGTTWTHPAAVGDAIDPDTPSATSSSFPRAAMGGNGEAVVVWSQIDGSGDAQTFMSEYRNSAWSHPASTSDHISPAGQAAENRPVVAMNAGGDAIVAWAQNDGSNDQIFISEYRNGTWSHPSGLTDSISPDGRNAARPAVALADNGDAVVVWEQEPQADNCGGLANCRRIFFSEFRDGSWSHPADLADYLSADAQDAFDARVAINATGATVIAWTQTDGSTDCGGVPCYQVYLSEYR